MTRPGRTYLVRRGARFLRLMAGYTFHRSAVKYPPFTLIVEPTNVCNLTCRMCFEARMTRPKGFMSLELARKVADQAVGIGVDHVQFAFGGEPTLHPELPALIRLFEGRGIRVELFTNAVLLTDDLGRALIDAGLSLINFSVDGFDSPTYEAIRPPATFEGVLGNIRSFDRLMAERGGRGPHRRLYVTPQAANREQLAAGLEKEVFGPYVDGYYYNAPNNWTGAVEGSVIGEQPSAESNRCMYVWVMMVIAHDGRVAPCPCDYNLSCELGNVNDMELSAIWQGEGLRRLRSMGKRNIPALPEICQSCLWRKASGPLRLLLKRARSELRVMGAKRAGKVSRIN